ncbi:MAG: cytochrome [Pseudobdellovibrionaceae bacterium]
MFLQGDLQAVFDALYTVGAIDPVLKLDWDQVINEMTKNPELVVQAMEVINACGGDKDLIVQRLHRMDTRAVNYIAMEVAREFVEFQDRNCLH